MEKQLSPAIAIPSIILFQVPVYFAAYETGYYIWISWGYVPHRVSLWLLSLYQYGMLFMILSAISASLHGFNWKYKWWFSIPLYLLFGFYLSKYLPLVPYRITLVFLSSFVAYFPPLLMIGIWNKRIAKQKRAKETIIDSEIVI